jgi:hypothetical protein
MTYNVDEVAGAAVGCTSTTDPAGGSDVTGSRTVVDVGTVDPTVDPPHGTASATHAKPATLDPEPSRNNPTRISATRAALWSRSHDSDACDASYARPAQPPLSTFG